MAKEFHERLIDLVKSDCVELHLIAEFGTDSGLFRLIEANSEFEVANSFTHFSILPKKVKKRIVRRTKDGTAWNDEWTDMSFEEFMKMFNLTMPLEGSVVLDNDNGIMVYMQVNVVDALIDTVGILRAGTNDPGELCAYNMVLRVMEGVKEGLKARLK